MIRIGTRVVVVELWDPDATDAATKRRFEVGETGTVTDHDPHREPKKKADCWLIEWDNGGACFMGTGEIERVQPCRLDPQRTGIQRGAQHGRC